MDMIKELPELVKAEVITEETANRIRDYYESKPSASTNRLFIAFGILGAILVGLGIILIIAHNWDELSRGTKTVFAFLPLIIGQLLCVFVLIKKQDNIGWIESTTAFLFFAIGASISLVSQIYNIPGDLSSFMLTWMFLCLPLVYIMRSSITSIFFLLGITYYACEVSYWSYPSSDSYLYWILLLMALPHYYSLYKKKPKSNFMIFHNWVIPLSLIISLGTLAKETSELMYIAYFSLLGLFYLVGNSHFFSQQSLRSNGYKVLGSLGTLILLLTLSFDGFWEDLRGESLTMNQMISTPEFYASVIISVLAGGVFYFQNKHRALRDIKPLAFVFMLFIIIFFVGLSSFFAVVLINILIFGVGVLIAREGAKRDHLGVLNYGLLTIATLVICRFFDDDLSFVIRGIMFVSVGVGCFAANYMLLKKRKTNE